MHTDKWYAGKPIIVNGKMWGLDTEILKQLEYIQEEEKRLLGDA